MKPKHLIKKVVVTEIVDGQEIKTILPKNEGERLFRTLRNKGYEADIRDVR